MSKQLFGKVMLTIILISVTALYLPEFFEISGSRLAEHLWNLGHVALFFTGSALFASLYPEFFLLSPSAQILIMGGGAMVMGGGIEAVQAFLPDRTPSVQDMVANCAGSLVFLSWKHRDKAKKLASLHLASMGFLLATVLPSIIPLVDSILAHGRFPILADFETPFEASRFAGTARYSICKERAFKGQSSLKVRFGHEKYSSLTLQDFPGNWLKYERLTCVVFNPSPSPVILHLRIHDEVHDGKKIKEYGDRYNDEIILDPGEWTRIEIPLDLVRQAPLTRDMDLNMVRRVGFFVLDQAGPLTLFIDEIILK